MLFPKIKRPRPVSSTVTPNHLLKVDIPRARGLVMLAGLFALSMALFGRAFYLMEMRDEFLQEKGAARYEREIEIPATRGRILDRNQTLIAGSTPAKAIWAIPGDTHIGPAERRRLADLLDIEIAVLDRKLSTKSTFVYLKRQVPLPVARAVSEMKLAGIHSLDETLRSYPIGAQLSHILGFTGVDGKGQEGMELKYEDLLGGTPGLRRVIKDRKGNVIEDQGTLRAPHNGEDIVLSIDAGIQHVAFDALQRAVETHKAKAGAVVVLDVKTGEVLALANLPTYNPNNRKKLSGAELRNRAFTDTYEPGSVMKPFIVGWGLEHGKVRPDTVMDVKKLMIGRTSVSDAHPHDVLTVEEVIQKSSNIGTVKVAMMFSPDEMWSLYDRLGFGKSLKLGFPGEASGLMRPPKRWKPIEQATMSYGHGLSVSLMHVAHAYLALARDEGDLVPVSLLKVDGPPPAGEKIYSRETIKALRKMLEMATSEGGTATKAQTPGYSVAGKTGTANKLVNGRYASKYVSSFVGFAPARDPRLVIAVMVDEPSAGGYYGGTVAGPVFSEIAGAALRMMGVPRDLELVPLKVKGKK